MSISPLRRQYLQIKRQYPEILLLFRLGDFYETFEDDARIASSVLGITLTSRGMGKGKRVPMAGIPHHALDKYLGKLIDAGHKVAICEQTSDPTEGRELVDREVVRVVTPGTVVEPG
ncbi:MAG: DNA mismatch repair protein MutS, partial [Chloroflexi bacterium]|nr:DNA mismatch repair protein MutS [Chloroflexota bacterium]